MRGSADSGLSRCWHPSTVCAVPLILSRHLRSIPVRMRHLRRLSPPGAVPFEVQKPPFRRLRLRPGHQGRRQGAVNRPAGFIHSTGAVPPPTYHPPPRASHPTRWPSRQGPPRRSRRPLRPLNLASISVRDPPYDAPVRPLYCRDRRLCSTLCWRGCDTFIHACWQASSVLQSSR